MRVYNLLIILLFLFSIGCRTKVNTPDIDFGTDKPFVQCYLNPVAERITLKLSVASVLSNQGSKLSIDQLKNAEVIIYDDADSVNIPFERLNYQAALFSLDQRLFEIHPGKKYFLQINLEDQFSLTAETTVPSNDYQFTETITGPRTTGLDEYIYDLDVNIQLPNEQLAYFNVGVGDSASHFIYYEKFVDNEGSFQKELNVKNTIDYYLMNQNNIELCVIRYNLEAYKFIKQIKTLANNDGNPFAEPNSLISNIQGGLGIFGGMYTKYKDL